MKPEEVQFPTAQRVQFLMSFDIQRRLESLRSVRGLAQVEQWPIGGAGRGCAADRPLR